MESNLLKRRILDTANICEKTNRPKFFPFLSLEQVAFAKEILKNFKVKFCFQGGFELAQRQMLGCFPDWCEDFKFPITPITATFRTADKLTHRDVLGSLMGLGLKREMVGDILIEEGRAIMFLTDEIAPFVLNELSKIGRVGVNLIKGFELPLPNAGRLTDLNNTIASDRLDCVVGALCGISRGQAVEKIEQSLVTVNSQIIEKTTHHVSEGDVISVRSYGKFTVDSINERTRKNRIVLRYKKYI